MTITEETKAAIVAARGRESAEALRLRFGLTKGQVMGIWHRRPRDTPEEMARAAATAQQPWTPETAQLRGKAGAVWAALLAAGPAGATADAIGAAMYLGGVQPASWMSLLYETIRGLRAMAQPHGTTVVQVPGSRPSRWRLQRHGAPAEAMPAPAEVDTRAGAAAAPRAAPPVAPDCTVAPSPSAGAASGRAPAFEGGASPDAHLASPTPEVASIGPALVAAAGSLVFTGAAAAHDGLARCSCRWPLGEPGDEGFRFCCAPVWAEGKSYCPEHRRQSSAGVWSARRAA